MFYMSSKQSNVHASYRTRVFGCSCSFGTVYVHIPVNLMIPWIFVAVSHLLTMGTVGGQRRALTGLKWSEKARVEFRLFIEVLLSSWPTHGYSSPRCSWVNRALAGWLCGFLRGVSTMWWIQRWLMIWTKINTSPVNHCSVHDYPNRDMTVMSSS